MIDKLSQIDYSITPTITSPTIGTPSAIPVTTHNTDRHYNFSRSTADPMSTTPKSNANNNKQNSKKNYNHLQTNTPTKIP